ncbi:hypothetical protein OE88DRAFT_743197 [Heliocybe sulcata]|uniref:Uncharacterized protein n=1 Tax=Heliocybe sulcata TaxID=5364 RepID=A0A5C3MS65_9AGAM|nr:hypothetical protein OE88DRAFT_743197 [Heliocybe sulcata]
MPGDRSNSKIIRVIPVLMHKSAPDSRFALETPKYNPQLNQHELGPLIVIRPFKSATRLAIHTVHHRSMALPRNFLSHRFTAGENDGTCTVEESCRIVVPGECKVRGRRGTRVSMSIAMAVAVGAVLTATCS